MTEAGDVHQPFPGSPVVRVSEFPDRIVVDSGTACWVVPRSGPVLVAEAVLAGRDNPVLSNVRLVSIRQGGHDESASERAGRSQSYGWVEQVVVEQAGPVKAMLKLTGRHRFDDGSHPWLDFVVRLVVYAGAADLGLQHTFIWDGDPETEVLAGLGVQADVPMHDPAYNRHIRIAGQRQSEGPDGVIGCLTEAVQPLTGLRRDPGATYRQAQIEGRDAGKPADWSPAVGERLGWIPTWSDFVCDQTSPDGFTLRKRTGPDQGWVTIPGGTRAEGLAYVGGVGGGAALGVRDFWQQYPTRMMIEGANTPLARLSAWLWSPGAPVMDTRPYHDGLKQRTFADQLDALEITYEDWEPGFNDARGIAKTHNLTVSLFAATPSADQLSAVIQGLQDPPLLAADPAYCHSTGVFGRWSLPDRSTPQTAAIEERLDRLVDFYLGQREQRRWYGFWDYGDVMHAYDPDRHSWRYDIGGYAWDNSELSTDLWLWLAYLRSGRADIFRLAEAMTRHTGETDVYHAGPWAGLGSRHNVQHWGCSAKQLRISNATYRRIYYYLTADPRTGDLLDELADSERSLLAVDATRKVRTDVYTPDPHRLAVGLGTDYGALAASWLTRWERYGDVRARDKLLTSLRTIAELPQGFFTGEALLDLDTYCFDTSRDQIAVSHLAMVFGLAENMAEILDLTEGTPWEVPGLADAWIKYCTLYNASPADQAAVFGHPLAGISLVQAYSRLTAYAAARTGDPALAARAWAEFRTDSRDPMAAPREPDWSAVDITGPSVLTPVSEIPQLSSNAAAQYGLAAIALLELLGPG